MKDAETEERQRGGGGGSPPSTYHSSSSAVMASVSPRELSVRERLQTRRSRGVAEREVSDVQVAGRVLAVELGADTQAPPSDFVTTVRGVAIVWERREYEGERGRWRGSWGSV